MLEEGLVSHLLEDVSLDAIVGDRITWSTMPQGQIKPAVVLHKVSSITDYAMSGPTGLVATRVQVDCWAESFSEAVSAARAVKNILSGAVFDLSTGESVQGAFLDSERHLFEDEQAEKLHRVSMDFVIWHSE